MKRTKIIFAILSVLLVGFTALYLLHYSQIDKVKTASASLEKIRTALEKYRFKYNQYPQSLSKLADDKLVREEEIRDPWGNDYNYIPCTSTDKGITDYMLYCNGRDGKPWTRDDVQIKK